MKKPILILLILLALAALGYFGWQQFKPTSTTASK